MASDIPTPLEAALAAVPDEIKVVRDWPAGQIIAEAERCADLISQAGITMWWDEQMLARQRKIAGRPLRDDEPKIPGRPPPSKDDVEINPDDVTAALARGLAILAIRPMGVEFAGLHLCDHPDGYGCHPGALAVDPTAKQFVGAVWTPRSLAQMVTDIGLEAVVYDPGPLHMAIDDRDKWQMLPPKTILTKSVADISVGAGSFPLAATRFLTDCIVEYTGAHGDAMVEQCFRKEVITNCLYGADIEPAFVELCRVAVALMVPLFDVDTEIWRRFRCGDAMLGITDLNQLRYMNMDFHRGRVRRYHPLVDIKAVAAQGGVGMLWLLADLVAGAALAGAGCGSAQNAKLKRVLADEIEHLAVAVVAGEPGALDAAQTRAFELINTSLLEGQGPRNPLHWPLAFPEVFDTNKEF